MSSQNDIARLVAAKHRQSMHSRMAASTKEGMALADESEANALRQNAARLLEGAVAAQEGGLTRQALFERLRLIALARAHALESVQHAMNLDEQAAVARLGAEVLREQARQHERKKNKIEHWRCQHQRTIERRKQRQSDNELQELYACQFQR